MYHKFDYKLQKINLYYFHYTAALKKKIGKKVGHNTQISGELLFIFLQSVKIYSLIFIYSPKGCTYVPQVWLFCTKKSTLITFTRLLH